MKQTNIGILLPKLFWPTVRKNCSSDRENLLKFEAEGQEFTKFLSRRRKMVTSERGAREENFFVVVEQIR